MLGAPPAFVLSQDQTLYKWYLSLKSVKSCSLSTQSLASCVNYFVWNCLTCFSNTKIGSVTSFSILFNFQGPVAPQPCGWRLDYFITEVIFCQALFSKFFVSYRTWSVLGFSALAGTFGRLLVLFALLPAETWKSFFCLGAWRSSIIPYAGPDVNTFCNFFQVFSCWLKSASSSCILQAKSFVFYNVLCKGDTV